MRSGQGSHQGAIERLYVAVGGFRLGAFIGEARAIPGGGL